MENPVAKFSRKDWLYIGGAVASIVAVVYLIARANGKSLSFGTQTVDNAISDVPAAGSGGASGAPVGYTNYNTAPINPVPLASGADVAPPANQVAGCGCQSDCAGGSPLATGDAFAGLDALLSYYQNTSPVYVALQQAQLQRYAAYFASGESYSRGGVPLGVAATG